MKRFTVRMPWLAMAFCLCLLPLLMPVRALAAEPFNIAGKGLPTVEEAGGQGAFGPGVGGGVELPPEVEAETYVVMDADTGQILVSKNAHMAQFPASITKILTMGLVLERVDMETGRTVPVLVSDAAVDALIPRASMIALGRGEVAMLTDLLYATKIESANDASHALAEYISGSMEAFADLMNQKTRQLGLADSNFTNPSGQPGDAHYTSAYDMAHITRWALSVPGFRGLFGATRYSMAPTNMQPTGREFNNANLALARGSRYYYEGVTGSKTGYTDQALYTLVTTAKRGDTELICVVLRCEYNEAKYLSTNALFDYCFNNFRRVNYAPGSAAARTVPVYGGADKPLGEIEVFAEGTASFLLHNSLNPSVVEVVAEVPERYVIGGPFEPVAVLAIPTGLAQQQAAQLARMPLSWRGLEDIMAANTTVAAVWERIAEESPVLLCIIIAVPSALLALALGRVAYVYARRSRLRRRRLEAVRAQLPVRIAQRPTPPARGVFSRGGEVDFRRPALATQGGPPHNGIYDSPRRPGRRGN